MPIEARNYKSTRPKKSRHFPHTYREDYADATIDMPLSALLIIQKKVVALEIKETLIKLLETFCKFHLKQKEGVQHGSRHTDQTNVAIY